MPIVDTTVQVKEANGTITDVDNVVGPGTTKRQRVHVAGLSEQFGTWDYRGGTDGTVNVPAGARVRSITAYSSDGAAGSLTINGGNAIPIPVGVGLSIELNGIITAPTLVFFGTNSYFVDFVT